MVVIAYSLLICLCCDKDNSFKRIEFLLFHNHFSTIPTRRRLCLSSPRSLSATPSTPAHTFLTGKRTGPVNNYFSKNKKKHKPPPPPPPVQTLQGFTLNIRGMTPTRWVSIQELSVFSTLDYINLTEHQLHTEFRPDEIIKSGFIMLYPVLSRPFPNEDIVDSATEVD